MRGDSAPQNVISHRLCKQFCQYAILIIDYNTTIERYKIPLLELAAQTDHPTFDFRQVPPKEAWTMLPPKSPSGLRLIVFPQTRYSFIEDEVRRSVGLEMITLI